MSFETTYCQEIQTKSCDRDLSNEARAHVAGCPVCAAHVKSCGELTARLRNLPSSRETMPSDLRDRMRQQLADTESPVVASISPFSQRFVLPVALAASLVMGVFLEKQFDFGSSFVHSSFDHEEVAETIGVYIADVTHDHYLLDRIARPLEVEITDAGNLSEWLSTSLSFAIQVPESDRTYTLQGGRVWHTVGRLSAMATYGTPSGSHVVLFAVPASNLELSGAESQMIGTTEVFNGNGWGHEARVWIDGDLAVAITAPEGELPVGWEDVFLP